ncbi:MAG: sugar phosphate isomerase/epimerase [Akkermansiaceae bacterium]|nr:sugar phosphate isomerase/epimerase [Armatimonadota bacterium]
MKLGVCAGADQARILADAGADYIELGVSGAISPLTQESEWAEKRKTLLALPLPTETFNVFLPGSLRITGEPEQLADTDTVRRYVFNALRWAREIGGEVIVFGSGGARRVPDGFSKERAAEQIRDFLRVCGEASDETGVVIAIEPLNQGECNIINTVAEAVVEYAAVLNHPGIRVLADTYHMELENEPISVIAQHAPFIAHVHTADTKRVAPGQGEYDHVALFRTLRDAGYTGRLSIEANFKDLPGEIADSIRHIRTAEKTAAS